MDKRWFLAKDGPIESELLRIEGEFERLCDAFSRGFGVEPEAQAQVALVGIDGGERREGVEGRGDGKVAEGLEAGEDMAQVDGAAEEIAVGREQDVEPAPLPVPRGAPNSRSPGSASMPCSSKNSSSSAVTGRPSR